MKGLIKASNLSASLVLFFLRFDIGVKDVRRKMFKLLEHCLSIAERSIPRSDAARAGSTRELRKTKSIRGGTDFVSRIPTGESRVQRILLPALTRVYRVIQKRAIYQKRSRRFRESSNVTLNGAQKRRRRRRRVESGFKVDATRNIDSRRTKDRREYIVRRKT